MRISVLLLFSLLAAGCAFEADVLPERISIVGGKLIDGTGAEPIPYSVIIVEAGKIRAVGSQAATPIPKGSTIVDTLGKTIIPGPVDEAALTAQKVLDPASLPATGRIEAGQPANLVILSTEIPPTVERVMRDGEWVER